MAALLPFQRFVLWKHIVQTKWNPCWCTRLVSRCFQNWSLCRQLTSNYFISSAEAKKPPVFDVPLKPLTVDEGEKLSLKCHVCGSAPLKVQWMKDRKELSSAGSIKLSFSDGTASLEISSASKHDAGDYLCKATNDAGTEFCKAKVTVKGKIWVTSRSSQLVLKSVFVLKT